MRDGLCRYSASQCTGDIQVQFYISARRIKGIAEIFYGYPCSLVIPPNPYPVTGKRRHSGLLFEIQVKPYLVGGGIV